MWHSILQVDEKKQRLFMARIFFLHDRASKRSGRAASCRLTLTEWNHEVERMCLAFFIQEQMKLAVNHDGNAIFDQDILMKVVKRSVDGRLGLFRLFYDTRVPYNFNEYPLIATTKSHPSGTTRTSSTPF